MLKKVFMSFVALAAIAAAAAGPVRGQTTYNVTFGGFGNSYMNITVETTLPITFEEIDGYIICPWQVWDGFDGCNNYEFTGVSVTSGGDGKVSVNYVDWSEMTITVTGAFSGPATIHITGIDDNSEDISLDVTVSCVAAGGGSTPEPQTVQLTLASNNSAMGYATVALHPEYELYDTYTTSSSTSGTKTSLWTWASVTEGAWINTTESNTSFSVNPNYGITIHHVTFYNANNQSVEVEPNDGNSVYVQLKNGNVYNDYECTQLLLSGGITRVEAYGMQMSLPAGVTATETAGVYDVVPGTQVPVAAVAKRHYQLNNWSNNATTDTVTVTVNAAMTLTANFVASPVLTLVANNAQMGRVEIPRHQGNGFLCEFNAVDYAGQQQSLSGMHEKFYFNTPSVAANSTVWTNNDDYSYGMSVNPEGFGHERNQCRVVFVGPNGETYEFDFSNNNNPFAEVYLKSGNTYSDHECNNLLWQGGVASIVCYGPGMILPDGVAQITDNTYSVLAGTVVPVEATAKLRYHFVNWSNNSTAAQTTFTMPATAATLTATFAANPTLTLTATPAHGGSVGFDFTPTPQTLTVNDGTATNAPVPIYLCNLDNAGTRGQHIIPAEQLGLMAGGTLNSITWYVNDESSWSSTSNVKVYLKEVANTTLTEYVNSDTTLVYTGTLSYADSQMTVTFSRPYTYQGGNLLVGVDNPTGGNYTCREFLGVEAPAGSSAGGSKGYYNAQSFLPKSTFNYTPALPAGVFANSDGTYSVAAGTELTLKANAAADYTLGSWSNQAEVNANATQTLTMPAADLTIGATFVGQPYTVRMAAGTEDAAHWSLASGDASVTGTGVLENVMSGSEVTATYNGTTKKVKSVKAVKYVAPPTLLDNTTTAWADGKYAVPAGGLTYSDAITVSGNVTLVLTDGETLTLNKGISLASGATLTIQGNGTMNVNGTNESTASTVAGTGTLVLTSGTLTATGGNGGSVDVVENDAHGGNGGVAINGSVIVSGGSLTARGGNGGSVDFHCADCSGGNGGAAISGSVTVNSGTLTATGGNGGSVGDYGYNCNGGAGSAAISGDLTINSGTETLTNGANGQLGQYTDECSAGAGGNAVAGTVTDNR